MTIAELIGIIIYAAAPVLIVAFNRDPGVIHYGVMQARIVALFYCLLAFSHCIVAVLRGSGHAAVPMIVMLCDWCLFRVSYITVAVRLVSDIRVILWGSSPHCWRRLGEPFMPMNRRQEEEAFVPPSTVPSMPEKVWLRDCLLYTSR